MADCNSFVAQRHFIAYIQIVSNATVGPKLKNE